MGELGSLFDAFYSRFVLRDLLAKVAPGAIFLFAVFLIFAESVEKLICYLAKLSFWTWIILVALAWIAGITIQSIGEKFRLIRYYPKWKDDNKTEKLNYKTWLKMRTEFLKKPDSEKREDERLGVIKEACGNGYVAFLVSSIILIFYGTMNTFVFHNTPLDYKRIKVLPLLAAVIIALIFIYFLRQMHFIHVQRQYDYMVEYLKAK
jgi:hypothetical protein